MEQFWAPRSTTVLDSQCPLIVFSRRDLRSPRVTLQKPNNLRKNFPLSLAALCPTLASNSTDQIRRVWQTLASFLQSPSVSSSSFFSNIPQPWQV
ncbi:unnamed protein product [Citrullus colocynthis]|uniref:Uncharacterized protein n=1 Tax=Citrullus colocynthis TaxID=252529 RepID=A0ABP0XVP4_9ROSI